MRQARPVMLRRRRDGDVSARYRSAASPRHGPTQRDRNALRSGQARTTIQAEVGRPLPLPFWATVIDDRVAEAPSTRYSASRMRCGPAGGGLRPGLAALAPLLLAAGGATRPTCGTAVLGRVHGLAIYGRSPAWPPPGRPGRSQPMTVHRGGPSPPRNRPSGSPVPRGVAGGLPRKPGVPWSQGTRAGETRGGTGAGWGRVRPGRSSRGQAVVRRRRPPRPALGRDPRRRSRAPPETPARGQRGIVRRPSSGTGRRRKPAGG